MQTSYKTYLQSAGRPSLPSNIRTEKRDGDIEFDSKGVWEYRNGERIAYVRS